MNERELLDLKKDIDSSKSHISRLQGRKDAELKELKELGCESVEHAKSYVKDLYSNANDLSDEIKEKMKEIEEQLKQGHDDD